MAELVIDAQKRGYVDAGFLDQLAKIPAKGLSLYLQVLTLEEAVATYGRWVRMASSSRAPAVAKPVKTPKRRYTNWNGHHGKTPKE